MATFSGKVKFACSATPIETLTDAESNTTLIAASTPHGTIGGGGEITLAAMDDAGGALFGYSNGSAYYVEAPVGSTVAVSTAADDFVVVKHTGFRGDSGGAKSTTVNTTDYLGVFVYDGSADRYVGTLAAGESMFVPLRGRASMYVKVRSTDSDGDASGGNTIACEFFAGT
jgi:hypothetical protein